MAVTELHRRLEHLVTYSSQLIFVSGDTIGEQQRSLQTFLGQQTDNTEIAYINAEAHETSRYYRQQIHQQLLGHQEVPLQRPLNELLAPLNHHDGPVLICICQAENLKQSFLQELWELVLQSRFAGNRQHLNVLLFGKPEWAEEAKSWLPAKNRNKPILLSTESFESVPPHPSQLDQLIATKRKEFEQRLQRRAAHNALPAPRSALQTWWFRLVVGLMFLATFAGILLWQYGEQVPQLWHQLYSDDNPMPTPIVDESTINTDVIAAESPFEILEAEQSVAPVPDDDGMLVSDWQTQVSLMRQKIRGAEPGLSTEDANSKDEQGASPSNTLAEPTDTQPSIFPEEAEVLDYPVEDIVSVEQLPTEKAIDLVSLAESPLESPGTSQETQFKEGVTPPDNESAVSQTQATPDSDTAEIPADPLSQIPDTHFVIQVAGLSSESLMQDFVRDNQLSDVVWTYRTEKFGGDWYVLLYNQSYSNINSARDAMRSLSNVLQKGTPFIKSIRIVRQEKTLTQ